MTQQNQPVAGPLTERIAIVTGASAGIGEATAAELVRLGARVVVNARRRERLDAFVENLGSDRAAACVGDFAEQGLIDAMFDLAVERFGSAADLVVVNAGRGLNGGLLDSDPEQWEEVYRTNVLGAGRLMRTAAERLLAAGPEPDAASKDGGDWHTARPRDIIAIGSVVGRHVSPFSSVYGGTKFAIHSYAEALRREIGPRGVRVSLVEPAIVVSEFQDVAGYDPERFGGLMSRVGPVLTPEDIGRAIGFLAMQPPNVNIADIVIRGTRQDYP